MNCIFWEVERQGRCNRYPPKPVVGPNGLSNWRFAETFPDQWCGEWRPIPEKEGYYAVATPVDSVADEE